MKQLIFLAFILMLFQPAVSYSEQEMGSLEIVIQYTNGDRVSPSEIVLKVYQDTHEDLFDIVEQPSSNPYYLTSLPLNHRYIVEVYANSMYSGVGSVDLKTTDAKLTITIPLSGGFRFNVFYDDGNTPIEGATVSIKSHDGRQWRQTLTDSEGKTLRFWMQSTIRESDYYIATISIGKNQVYEQSYIKLEPGSRKEVKVVTPWPSRVDQLIINIYKTPSEKLSESDGKVIAELHGGDGKVVESVVNRKGDAFFTNIGVGDYILHIFREHEGLLYDLEDWGSMNVTIASRQLSMKFVRSEPFVSSWDLSNASLPSIYDAIFSSLISNPGSITRNVTISLIFDRDQTPPYDISKELTLPIPAGSTQNVQLKITPNYKGLYYAYITTTVEKSIITDQIPWQHAFDVTKVPPINIETPVSKNVNVTISEMTSDNLQRIPHSCNCVAFRLDDIQDHFTREAQKDLIGMFLEENAALTIGVIGGFLHDDNNLIQFLQNAVSEGSIEVANHSWNHKDHSAMTLDQQRDSIVKTNERIKELFRAPVKTFIPPENGFNRDTLSVMKDAGLTHLSGSVFVRDDEPPYPLKNGDSIFHFPQTAFVSNVDTPTGRWTIFTNEQVVEMIKTSVEQYGFAVVSIHPVAYYNKEDSSYIYHKERIEPLRTLLNEVKKKFDLVTISEIDKQGWIPKHAKESLITDLGAGHGFVMQSRSGTQIDDTNDFVLGSQSLKLTTRGDGQAVFTRKTNMSPAIDFTGKFLKVWIKVNDTSEIRELRVTVTSDNFATFKNYRIHVSGVSGKDFQNNQWNVITIMPAQSDDSGTPNISNVNTIQLRLADKGNGAVSVWFNGLALLELEDTLGDISLYNHTVSWKGNRAIVASTANINIEMRGETLFLSRAGNSWGQPFLLLIPKALVPQESVVIVEDTILPTMGWFDSDSQTWIVYLDPPRSVESLHVVPEFDLTLMILTLTFGFLLFTLVFQRVRGFPLRYIRYSRQTFTEKDSL